MIEPLLSAKQILDKLKAEKVVPWGKARFSQLKKQGIFTLHKNPPSTRDFFKYSEVLEAIEANEDPRREAQRLANERKREQKDLLSPEYKNETEYKIEYTAPKHISKEPTEVPPTIDEQKAVLKDLITQTQEQDLRIKRVKADEAEAKSIKIEEVELQVYKLVSTLKENLLNMPPKVAPLLVNETNIHTIIKILNDELINHLLQAQKGLEKMTK